MPLSDNVKDLKSYPEHETNPSWSEAQNAMTARSRAVVKAKGKTMLVGRDTGEVLGEGSVVFHEDVLVDRQPFCKVYSELAGDMFDLPKGSQRVLAILFQVLGKKKNSDEVSLHVNMCPEYGESMSRRTFDRGIAGLLEAEFLYRTKIPHSYYFNVTRLFNGDRVHKIKTYQLNRILEPEQQALAFGEQRSTGLIIDNDEGVL